MSAARRVVEVGEGWGGWGRLLLSLAAACAATTCTSSRTSTNLPQPPARYEPAHDLGVLFHDVQLSGIFEDSKTFADARSTLIPLPNPYVVPGGRFREVYYWDSYFTMLGLIASGRTDLVKSMLD